MKLTKLHETPFKWEDHTIIRATLATPEEFVILLSNGAVTTYKRSTNLWERLFSTDNDLINYSDGGFDLASPVSIYTLDTIVVIVNDYKSHGYVHYPGKCQKLHLWREDYHADISRYPIALFKDKTNTPHLIYSEAWNKLQMMNLDTGRY
jgi:hypothetical protein